MNFPIIREKNYILMNFHFVSALSLIIVTDHHVFNSMDWLSPILNKNYLKQLTTEARTHFVESFITDKFLLILQIFFFSLRVILTTYKWLYSSSVSSKHKNKVIITHTDEKI